jgi:uncharacterized membrane protein
VYFVAVPFKSRTAQSLFVNAYMGSIIVIETEILKIFGVSSTLPTLRNIKVMQICVVLAYMLCHVGVFLTFDDSLAVVSVVNIWKRAGVVYFA